MNIFIQHHHYDQDISGVLTYYMKSGLHNLEAAIKGGFESSQYLADKFSPALIATQLLTICHNLLPKT